jgi:peptidyl-prolyl cis-trans isomerase D
MITFFRRILSSWVVLGLFALILVAFVITGVNLPGGGSLGSLGASGTTVAQIGGSTVEANELMTRAQAQLASARRDRPDLDMAAFIRSGGLDQTVDQIVTSRAFERFGNQEGIFASTRLVDGTIASVAAFKGPTGAFDRNIFLAILNQQQLTERGVRSDIAREKVATMVIVPAGAAARIPGGVAAPYASLLLEEREGAAVLIPNAAMPAGAPPTDAELAAYYKQNIARYSVPETRTLRYAAFDRRRLATNAVPSEAEIAAAYKANAAIYGGTEKRILTQIIVQDQKTATAIAAKINSRTDMAEAAKAAEADATALAAQTQSSYAGLSTSAIAAAAFAAKQGDLITPAKSGLGWHVVRVDKIERTPGKSLADVRSTLAADLSAKKVDGLLADFVTKVEDAIADGATFDDVVKAEGLTVQTTPAIAANGVSPDNPSVTIDPSLAPILRDAFQAELEDDASVISLGAAKGYALYDLDRINPAAPRTITQVRDQMIKAFRADRASKAARTLANQIAAGASKGKSLADAVRASGVALSAPRPIGAQRLSLVQAKTGVPKELDILFRLGRGQARAIESDNRQGWFVVALTRIKPGNIATQPALVPATQEQMAQIVADEYVAQFANAVKANVSTTLNPAAIAKVKSDLTGAAR